MIGASPYRSLTSSSTEEDELWLRLDDALLEAMRDPVFAWSIAWNVAIDAEGFTDVQDAAVRLLENLLPSEIWDTDPVLS